MPSLDSLDRFKETVNSLGNEPEILAERGERIEDVERPTQGLPEDLSELLGGPSEEEEDSSDINALLDSFESEEEAEEGPPEAESESEAESEAESESEAGEEGEEPFDEFDLDALIEETTPQPEGSPEGGAPPAGEEEDVDLEIGDVSADDVDIDIDADFAELGTGDEGSEPEKPEELPEEEFEMPDLGGFEEPGEAAEPEPVEEAAEPEDLEGLDIDADLADLGLDDMDFEGPEPGEEEPAEAEEPEEAEGPEVEELEGGAPEEEFGDFDLSEFEEDFGAGELFGEEEPADPGEPGEPEEPEEEIEFEEPAEEPGGEVPEEFGDMDIQDIDFDAVPDAEEFEMPSDLEGGGADEELDQFNLDSLGEEFSLGDEELSEEELNPAVAVAGELEEAGDEFHISDTDFKQLRHTLGTLPRNLKIAVEELIAEKGLAGEDLETLTGALAAGESPKALAGIVGQITGKKIKLPALYEKRTGAEFEEEQGSFSYIFRTRVLPYLKVGLAALVVAGFLGFLGYRFIYRPLHAESLYRQGYAALEDDRYNSANLLFDEAVEEWERRKWFFRYAEGYIDKKQYYLAGEKYEQLLEYHPGDKEGILDYARLESEILGDYAEAEDLLERILDVELYDYDALLLSGDNYMRWARIDQAKYEEARIAYAKMIQHYGFRDEISFRMLRYFIRTDNYEEVLRLKNHFQGTPNAAINPEIYAELGGYLISNNQLDDVKDILFAAKDVDETIPEIHYHLARYFNELEDYSEEDKALANALHYFEEAEPLARERLGMLVDTYNRSGESFYRKEEYLTAEQQFQKGIQLYEDALDRRLLGPAAMYGELYANLGDIYYYISGNLNTALELYEEARRSLYSTPQIRYKKGYINYTEENYQQAMMEFYQAAEGFSTNKNLMYSMANTLYQRGEYFAAQGYYNHLLDVLEREEANIPFLMIQERNDHRSIVEYFMKAYNNLGVTLNRLAARSPDPQKYSRSLAYLTRSTEYSDILTRNPETLERSAALDLAFLNTRAIIYPPAENEPQIYARLPRDMQDLLF